MQQSACAFDAIFDDRPAAVQTQSTRELQILKNMIDQLETCLSTPLATIPDTKTTSLFIYPSLYPYTIHLPLQACLYLINALGDGLTDSSLEAGGWVSCLAAAGLMPPLRRGVAWTPAAAAATMQAFKKIFHRFRESSAAQPPDP
ncbi:hypothetical protein PTTG_08155 [Puccinia triticina 1-1 BBBD Race 1]|uniref:Uncharacterized protein n=2 Tax=Puccinia triticina TaxID=208348 RepID=A0A180GAS9_PUCT1|nr:uncharacterized protein PtA15_13A289 [Puccinia triticina]OAV89750.1 hypothetical protein PTTG_08155 [Puccinia triticina 1-1 BBBD Race 1]WAQ90889.1 hypothetical protein PtA15_13A289 [Puccinia triticina]WAR61075.1 hypothetical protein PtB15_13B327 [Puccinia triticina]